MPQLKIEQLLPITIDTAWDFFSSPANLNVITPESMRFTIISELPDKIYSGLLIHYKISPLPFTRFNWTTKITDVEDPFFFADEQIKGPYKLWRHEHMFEIVPGGVKITDTVTYEIGKSFLGWIAGKLFVHKKVKKIFSFRKKKLDELFPKGFK
jgi:ligand-binding SRPBCC domain-containing protein